MQWNRRSRPESSSTSFYCLKIKRPLLLWICLVGMVGFLAQVSQAQVVAPAGAAAFPIPAANDFTKASLDQYWQAIERYYGGYHQIPLEVKAEYFEWLLFRYMVSPDGNAYVRCLLPDHLGVPVAYWQDSDTSTWNGALLAALSHKYSLTRDPRTLYRIGLILRGLHKYQEVTEKPGFICRDFVREGAPILNQQHVFHHRYTAPDGKVYFYAADPAKGGYNQVMLGYGMLLVRNVYDALPQDLQALARQDVEAIGMHLIEHDYHLTNKDGEKTAYGNILPMFGTTGVPFNAQVAYSVISTAFHFPAVDPGNQERLQSEFHRLRSKHHVYYEKPFRSLVFPQRVGASPFMKGMNDRNHVTNAAYNGLMLELWAADRAKRAIDKRFMYQLGQTMVYSMDYLKNSRNSLCNFMWLGMLTQGPARDTILDGNFSDWQPHVPSMMNDGVEQLRRYPLNRMVLEGEPQQMDEPQWVDAYRPDSYIWKTNLNERWIDSGNPSPLQMAPIDFLHAYWLMRSHFLDEQSFLDPRHRAVLLRGRRVEGPPPMNQGQDRTGPQLRPAKN
ncbi:Hypothetical protein PBC10988_8370 [Planctomycetales bacterium 10988]|nr:Hypothetical protein PBC10988_8370 [Planctomycetales bacterium 10988]